MYLTFVNVLQLEISNIIDFSNITILELVRFELLPVML